MSRELERVEGYHQKRIEAAIDAARRAAAKIPGGAPGVCHYCGEDMPRLVGGKCVRCREKRR